MLKHIRNISFFILLFSVSYSPKLFANDCSKLKIHILDVGEADSIFIEAPCDEFGMKKILLVDAGEDRLKSRIEADKIYEYLKKVIKKNTVDYVMLTNYNEEHMGRPSLTRPTGIFYLKDKKRLRIRKIIDRGLEIDSKSLLDNKYREWTIKKKIKRETVQWSNSSGRGNNQIKLANNIHIETIAFNTIYDKPHNKMAITGNEKQLNANENNFSIVFVLHYRRFQFYFGSDIPGYKNSTEGLENVSGRYLNRLKTVEVCKVADHGSNTGTRNDLLQVLRPKVSIISCGKGNKNPNPQLLTKLLGYSDKKSKIPIGSDIFQTSEGDGWVMNKPFKKTGKIHTVVNNNIVIETDGKDEFCVKYTANGTEVKKVYPMHKFALD